MSALSPLSKQLHSPASNASDIIPRHTAIIMDGNHRWAQQRSLPALNGHRAGAENIRTLLRYYARSSMEILTLFAFSSENWNRSQKEVSDLWGLFAHYLDTELDELLREGVRIRFIGRRDKLSASLREKMGKAEERTHNNKGRILVVATDYGGRWDIVNTTRRVAADAVAGRCAPEDIDEQYLRRYLSLGDLGDPDLCIRTGGEHRVSNFLLWQLAYTEFYFSDTLWPDFDVAQFELALQAYSERQRRFGERGDSGT